MTRVAMVSYDGPPPLGGQGVVVRDLSGALRARGVEVTLINGRGEGAVVAPVVTGRPPVDLSLHLNRCPRLITRCDPDVVHAHGGPGGVTLLCRLGVPLIYTANHTYAQAHRRGAPQRLAAPLEARAYRRATWVVAISPSTAAAVRRLGVPAGRIEVLPPGVDPPALDEGARDPFRIVFAGRLEPEKGALDALDVLRGVLLMRPQASAAIIGDGSLGQAVRERARHLERLEVLGRVSDERLADELARAAVLLMPSRYEGLGLAALQAQAAGVVVAGYNVTGLRDAVRCGEGVLVEPGNVRDLAVETVRLLDDSRRREAMAAAASCRVRRDHDWSRLAARMEQVYEAARR